MFTCLYATLDYFNWFMDFGLRMTQGYQLENSLSQRLFKNIFLTHWTLELNHVLSLATQTLKTFFYNVLFELGGLPHMGEYSSDSCMVIRCVVLNRSGNQGCSLGPAGPI